MSGYVINGRSVQGTGQEDVAVDLEGVHAGMNVVSISDSFEVC